MREEDSDSDSSEDELESSDNEEDALEKEKVRGVHMLCLTSIYALTSHVILCETACCLFVKTCLAAFFSQYVESNCFRIMGMWSGVLSSLSSLLLVLRTRVRVTLSMLMWSPLAMARAALCLKFLLSCRLCNVLILNARDSGRVAFAYYDPVKGILHVLEDTQETSHFDLTRMRE